MTRSQLLFLSVLLASFIGVGVYWAMQPLIKPGVTIENFRRLYKYMTTAQVEEIPGKGERPLGSDIEYWKSGETEAAIAFFDYDAAATGSFFDEGKHVATLRAEPEGWWESFRLWVHRRMGW